MIKRHSRAHIIGQRIRYVARRLRLVRRVLFGRSLEADDWQNWKQRNAGRLSKWNTVCSCGICRDEKYRDKRGREKARIRRKMVDDQN
ncbi:MAG: hypothetical protein K6T65_09120 [Peptococcaceae bacterium]|nr:hypothetical protein [Peptococcaceae bacterium]